MSKIIQQLEQEQLKSTLPEFAAGDTVAVKVRVTEGNRERLQTFEGVVIAKKNRGLNSSFTVRKISNGEAVEYVFQTHSPIIAEVKVKRHGAVRRAKLYYLRGLTGKKARIKQKILNKAKMQAAELVAQAPVAEPEPAPPEPEVKEAVKAEENKGEDKA